MFKKDNNTEYEQNELQVGQIVFQVFGPSIFYNTMKTQVRLKLLIPTQLTAEL